MMWLVRFLTALVFLFTLASAYADKFFDDDEVSAIMKAVQATRCENKCVVKVKGELISVQRFDINNDGKKEYIISRRNECGSAGCPVGIVLQEGSRYREIFESFEFLFLNTRTNGFRDILAGYEGPDFSERGPAEIIKWNGHDYAVAAKRPQTGPKPKGMWTGDLYK